MQRRGPARRWPRRPPLGLLGARAGGGQRRRAWGGVGTCMQGWQQAMQCRMTDARGCRHDWLKWRVPAEVAEHAEPSGVRFAAPCSAAHGHVPSCTAMRRRSAPPAPRSAVDTGRHARLCGTMQRLNHLSRRTKHLGRGQRLQGTSHARVRAQAHQRATAHSWCRRKGATLRPRWYSRTSFAAAPSGMRAAAPGGTRLAVTIDSPPPTPPHPWGTWVQ